MSSIRNRIGRLERLQRAAGRAAVEEYSACVLGFLDDSELLALHHAAVEAEAGSGRELERWEARIRDHHGGRLPEAPPIVQELLG